MTHRDFYRTTWLKTETVIAGIPIKKGDRIEILLGRDKKIVGVFEGYDERVYAVGVVGDDGKNYIVPYKYIKMISVQRERP